MAEMTQHQLKKLLEEVDYILTNTPESIKKLDSEFWIFSAIKDLYELSFRNNQSEFETGEDGYSYCKKVIRYRGYLQEAVIKKHSIESAFFEGLWIALEGILIHPDHMSSYFNRRLGGKVRMDPVNDLGFPDDIQWGSMRAIPNGYGFALRQTGIVSEGFIVRPSQWEYLLI